jgi:DNA-binding ferritin-like protein (Dps family)
MPLPNVLGYVDFVRLIAQAIADGRTEAKTVAEMTDDQVEAFIQKLLDETQAEVDRGNQLEKGHE